MKKLLLGMALMAASTSLWAQDKDDKDEEYELRGDQKFGYIVTDKGEKIEGVVKLLGDEKTPWVNQKKVKFIAKKDIDPTKKWQRLKKYDTDDLKEYVAYDGDKERHFRLVKWANTREAITSEGKGAGGTFKQIKNFSTTRHMAEAVVYGKITVYRIYGYPAAFAAGEGDIKRMEQETQELIDYPTILVQKEDGKVSTFQAGDIKDLVKDCDMVKEKLEKGEYSTYKPEKEEKKRSGMGKLLKDEVDRAGKGGTLVDMGAEIFGDYNANCK
jgi:hypothetical protein